MNDNMSHSHYHTYFELYFLEGGERHHVMQDQQYETKVGSFMIFAPYIMHYSFSDHDVSFKRTVLYFKDEAVASPVLLDLLKNGSGLYEPEQKISSSIHFLLNELQKEQERIKVWLKSEKQNAPDKNSRKISVIVHHHTGEEQLQKLKENFKEAAAGLEFEVFTACLLYTSPSPRD